MKKQRKISKLKKIQTEIKIKDLIIKELLVILTNNKIKINEDTLKIINTLYGGNENGKEKR